MEEDLMLKIKNDLAEMKYNGVDIQDIKMYYNLEQQLVISYKYKGETYLISNDLINIEEK